MKNILLLIGCIVICYSAGAIGSIYTFQSIPTWYAGLVKPPLNPPNWIFGPVWTALYTLMAISLFLIIKKGFAAEGVKLAVIFFAIQLVLNALWSFVFFGARTPLNAIPVIAAMWILILACVITFWRISKPASIMMMPYLLWVGFASYLNVGVYFLNR
jgi:tryptophan-rich sensory protein